MTLIVACNKVETYVIEDGNKFWLQFRIVNIDFLVVHLNTFHESCWHVSWMMKMMMMMVFLFIVYYVCVCVSHIAIRRSPLKLRMVAIAKTPPISPNVLYNTILAKTGVLFFIYIYILFYVLLSKFWAGIFWPNVSHWLLLHSNQKKKKITTKQFFFHPWWIFFSIFFFFFSRWWNPGSPAFKK